MTREEALDLLYRHVQQEGLRRHLRATAVVMEAYARERGENPDLWFLTGLLHDLDYEETPEEHPHRAVNILETYGFPEAGLQAIQRHATPDQPAESPLDQYLRACDELTGFLIAVALVRPSRSFADIRWSSFRKKWKDRAFARGVHREAVERAVQEAGLSLQPHVMFMLKAMAEKEPFIWDGS
jgi:putative nucleotidyltransferase with HDIG domain